MYRRNRNSTEALHKFAGGDDEMGGGVSAGRSKSNGCLVPFAVFVDMLHRSTDDNSLSDEHAFTNTQHRG